MNKIIGFFGSYVDGFAPSRIPPCGVARSPSEVAAAAAAAVFEMAEEIVLDMVSVFVCLVVVVCLFLRSFLLQLVCL